MISGDVLTLGELSLQQLLSEDFLCICTMGLNSEGKMTRYATVYTVQVHVLSAIPKMKVTSHSYPASEMNIIIVVIEL